MHAAILLITGIDTYDGDMLQYSPNNGSDKADTEEGAG
jgi:hypothetical protein